uniref:Cytochrome P450 n=1 Tax=Perinereis nuntia TaxID=460893 RepID=U3KVB5_PERNU|nr:cytochrome P450 [Perinereis nuntia]
MNILGVIQIADWFLVVVCIGVAFYIWSTWTFNKFKDQGIPGPKPYPIVGTGLSFLIQGFIDSEKNRMRKYGNFYGTFMGRTPQWVIARDELLTEVLVKQFPCFGNRRAFSDGSELVESFLTVLVDEDWKRVRNLLTPTFSSGKLKMMMHQMNKCGAQLAENIGQLTSKPDPAFDTKEVSGCYTMDVIGGTAFGVDVNSLKDPESIFVKHAKKIFSFSLFSPFFLVAFFAPFLLKPLKKMGFQMFPKDSMNFFQEVTEEAIAQRKANTNKGGNTDLIQLMVNAHNIDITDEQKAEATEYGATYEKDTKEKGLKNVEILANGMLFFLAGYDTTATMMSLLLYQLAIEQEVQEKLYNEIQDVIGDKEKVDYNDIMKLQYLDMCINETLRMYPAAPIIDRICSRDVTINGIEFKKGDVVVIPVLGIHFDEKRWPNPEVFNPERFAPEEKKNHGPFDWMPFGYGPRNCVGMRLALLEAKVATVHVLRKHRLVTCEKTKTPLKFDKIGFRVKAGIWISAEPREN